MMYEHANQPSMCPPKVLVRPCDEKYRSDGRMWQGIPGIERTAKGYVYVDFYSGGKTEQPGNFIVVSRGRDEWPLEQWEDALAVIEHGHPEVRCYDPCMWIDPLGRLWITWAQSRGYFDGRCGVWAIVSENPDDDNPT